MAGRREALFVVSAGPRNCARYSYFHPVLWVPLGHAVKEMNLKRWVRARSHVLLPLSITTASWGQGHTLRLREGKSPEPMSGSSQVAACKICAVKPPSCLGSHNADGTGLRLGGKPLGVGPTEGE